MNGSKDFYRVGFKLGKLKTTFDELFYGGQYRTFEEALEAVLEDVKKEWKPIIREVLRGLIDGEEE